MRLPKSIVYLLAIVVCAFAAYSAHAQSAQTNIATFTATMNVQQPSTSGPNFEAVSYKTSVLNTAGLISELTMATHTNTFSKAAKLAVIGGQNPQFEIIDGTNTVVIGTNILNMFPAITNQVVSGKLTSNMLTEKTLMVLELDFNDVGMGASDLQFFLRGVGSIAMTETATSQSTSAKIAFVGGGMVGPNNTNLIVTATLSGSGK